MPDRLPTTPYSSTTKISKSRTLSTTQTPCSRRQAGDPTQDNDRLLNSRFSLPKLPKLSTLLGGNSRRFTGVNLGLAQPLA